MPKTQTKARAARAQREGKAPTTQAGEFVHEEIHHVRSGKHGARNTKQAIAIGLSKARRAGVKVGAAKRSSAGTRKKAAQEIEAGQSRSTRARKPSTKRSQGATRALKRQGRGAASKSALSRQGKKAAAKRGAGAKRKKKG